MNDHDKTEPFYTPNPSATQSRDEPMSQPPVVPHSTDQPMPNNTDISSMGSQRLNGDTDYDLGNHPMDEFEVEFRRYETDYSRFEEENRNQPAEWWDDSKRKVQTSMRGLRSDLDQARANGPEAWEEMKSGMRNALDELKAGYRHAVRELKD